jgi:Mg2+/Co2+ transporter CorC
MEAPSAGSSENPSEQKEFSEAVASLQASDHRENREDILSVIRAASTERVLLNIGGYKVPINFSFAPPLDHTFRY